MKKVCTKCGIEKELEEFCKDKRRPLGFGSHCKECVKEYKKEYQEKNKDKIKEKCKKYYEQNKEKIKERLREYYEQNKDEIKGKVREYARKNNETIKEKKKKYYEQNKGKAKEYREKHRDKRKKYNKEYKKINKEKIKEYNKEYKKKYYKTEHGRMMQKINRNRRREKAKENGGNFTPEEWQEAMQFFNNSCAWSGKPLTDENESIDHIYPNSKGGTLNINNIVPCDRLVNISKNNNNWEEWYPKQPFYSKEREKKIREWIELKTAISLFD